MGQWDEVAEQQTGEESTGSDFPQLPSKAWVLAEVIADADPAVKDIVIDMGTASFTDTEGADMIETVTEEMGREGIQIHLAHVHSQVLNFLKEVGTDEVVGIDNIHEDVFDAVRAIQERKGSADD